MGKTPWHIWVVGILALLWNSIGAYDYVMTQTKNAEYLSNFTEVQLAYFDSFPTWVQACWATAIWLSVLGSILLLMRNRGAVLALGISFIAMVVTTIHNFGLAETKLYEVTGQEAIPFAAVIFVISLLLWIYARSMRQRGVLE